MIKNNKTKVEMITYFYEVVILVFASAFFFFIRQDLIGSLMVFSVGILFLFYRIIASTKSKNKKIYNDIHTAIKELALSLKQEAPEYDENNNIQELNKEICKIKEKYNEKDISRKKILKIIESIAVNIELDKLTEDLLPKLSEMTKSTCSAIYLTNQSNNKLEIKYSIGFSKNIYSEFDIEIGEGFIGIAAHEKKVIIINDIPDDTIYLIRTFLGKIKPKAIMIIPIVNNDEVIGVFLMASLYEYTEAHVDIVNIIKHYVGVAISNGIIFEKTKRLTNELKFQNSLIQNLSEDLELKVKNRTSFLTNIIDSCFDYAIYTLNNEGIITYFSKGAENIMGYLAKDVVDKNIATVMEEESIIFEEIKNSQKELYKLGKFTQTNLRHKKDGDNYTSEMVTFIKYDEDKKIIGYTNVIRKILNIEE